jgi:hypothetical protein
MGILGLNMPKPSNILCAVNECFENVFCFDTCDMYETTLSRNF